MKFKVIVRFDPDLKVVLEACDPCVILNLAGRCIIALRKKGFDPKLDYCPIEGLPITMEASMMKDVDFS